MHRFVLYLLPVLTLWWAEGPAAAQVKTAVPGRPASDTAEPGTFAEFCAGATGKTLMVTKLWADVPAQTCGADLWFYRGGVIQPASGASVTLSGSVVSGEHQIFDLSRRGGASINLTGQTARVTPAWWGAVADFNGSRGTDNVAPFSDAATAAMKAGAELSISPGKYYFSGPLILPHAETYGGVFSVFRMAGTFANDVGYGAKGSVFYFASGGIVQQGLSSVQYKDFEVQCLANGCPAFDWNGFVADTVLDHIVIASYNPTEPLIRGRTDKGEIERIRIEHFEWTPAKGHAVPALDFLNSAGGNSNMNFIDIRDGIVHGSSTASAPVIRMDCAAAGCYQNTIERVLFETVPAGAIEWRSINESVLSNVAEADSGKPTAPFITLAASFAKGGESENNVTLVNPGIGAGTPEMPSLLIDNTNHPYSGQFTIIGGILPYTRTQGLGPAVPLAINVRTGDKRGIAVLSTDQNFGTGFFLNSSTGNGTMSFAGSGAMGGCTSGKDLALSGDDGLSVSSASYKFTDADVGGYVGIRGGSGWTPGDYQVISVSGSGATLNHSPALSGATNGSWDVNRGRITFVRGDGGSPDTLKLCSRDASGAYSWKTP
jgi:hypothetical protein